MWTGKMKKKKEKKETENNEKLRETSAFLQYNPVQYYIFLLFKTVNYDKIISLISMLKVRKIE